MIRLILFFTLLLATTGCTSLKKIFGGSETSGEQAGVVTDTSASTYKEPKELKDKEPFRLVVSFYSQGAGPDSKAIEMFIMAVSSYEHMNNKKIEYDKTPWGREGEVDYCMKLQNLDAESQKNFVMQIRETLLTSQLVHITENAPCLRKH